MYILIYKVKYKYKKWMKPNSTRHVLTSASCKAVPGNYYLIFLKLPTRQEGRRREKTLSIVSCLILWKVCSKFIPVLFETGVTCNQLYLNSQLSQRFSGCRNFLLVSQVMWVYYLSKCFLTVTQAKINEGVCILTWYYFQTWGKYNYKYLTALQPSNFLNIWKLTFWI